MHPSFAHRWANIIFKATPTLGARHYNSHSSIMGAKIWKKGAKSSQVSFWITHPTRYFLVGCIIQKIYIYIFQMTPSPKFSKYLLYPQCSVIYWLIAIPILPLSAYCVQASICLFPYIQRGYEAIHLHFYKFLAPPSTSLFIGVTLIFFMNNLLHKFPIQEII